MCSEEVMVVANPKTLVLGRQCEWVIMIFFGGSGKGYPLVYLLGIDGVSEIVSTIGVSDGNIYGKLEVYPMV